MLARLASCRAQMISPLHASLPLSATARVGNFASFTGPASRHALLAAPFLRGCITSNITALDPFSHRRASPRRAAAAGSCNLNLIRELRTRSPQPGTSAQGSTSSVVGEEEVGQMDADAAGYADVEEPGILRTYLPIVDEILRGAGQVVFCNSPLSGLVVFGALGYGDPVLAVSALFGGTTATLVARFAHFDPSKISDGLYGYNGLLTGCAAAVFFPFIQNDSTLVLDNLAVAFTARQREDAHYSTPSRLIAKSLCLTYISGSPAREQEGAAEGRISLQGKARSSATLTTAAAPGASKSRACVLERLCKERLLD
eukprot:6177083-Pleurochrysis_carterae.AAC.6